MAKNKNVAIIGHFGGKEAFMDGQTVKTKILYEELRRSTQWNIQKVDTYYKRKNPIKLIWDTLRCLVTCRDVIVLLSGNGMRLYFPVLAAMSGLFGLRVYHDVIGGNLDTYVDRYPKFRKYLNSFRVNWVETQVLRRKLEDRGITNARVIPNFKRLNVAGEDTLAQTAAAPFRFCTFSRVMKEKGIEDAVTAVENINREAGRTLCALDIYGKVDDGYTQRFGELMSGVTDAVQYRGIVPFDKSVEAIRDYYALLFPTYWDGEGFAGTLVDAFSAGLPVIATDWNCNGEIVENGVTGLLYPSEEYATLEEAIRWAIGNTDSVLGMKRACVRAAQGYQPEQYIRQIVEKIEK